MKPDAQSLAVATPLSMTTGARGFIRGVEIRKDQWANLINSDDHGGSILPMLMLFHEHDPDPEMRPKAIGPEQREEIIAPHGSGVVADLPLLPEPT